jgi:hypothetical protein
VIRIEHRAALAATLLLLLLLPPGCARPDRGGGGTPPWLYVANAVDGTVTRIDAASGRALGLPVPAGPSPDQVVPGPAGSLVILSLSLRQGAGLTLATPAGGTWAARPLGVEAGAGDALLAGDGGRHVAVAYHLWGRPPGDPRCRLVVLDLVAGSQAGPFDVCAPGETVTGAALNPGAVGGGRPVVYLGVAGPSAGAPGTHRGRLVAAAGETGTPVAAAPTAGVPSNVVLAPAPGGAGRRLYVVETFSLLDEAPPSAYRGRLLGLDPTTLAAEVELALPAAPGRVAVGPDGDEAYALVAAGTVLLRLDLRAGAVNRLAELPGQAITLAVTRTRIYVPDPAGRALWALDRRSGRVVQTLPVGRGPMGITLAGAS